MALHRDGFVSFGMVAFNIASEPIMRRPHQDLLRHEHTCSSGRFVLEFRRHPILPPPRSLTGREGNNPRGWASNKESRHLPLASNSISKNGFPGRNNTLKTLKTRWYDRF